MSPLTTISELNERNRRFWEEQNALRDRRIADEAILETALARLTSEQVRGIPLYYQMSLEQALADAKRDDEWSLSQQGRKGGRAKKSDALQQAILDLVRRDPDITEAKLKDVLTRERFPGLIEDVNEDTIYFKQPDGSKDGRLKEAPISGLKHRLSHAKKALKSR